MIKRKILALMLVIIFGFGLIAFTPVMAQQFYPTGASNPTGSAYENSNWRDNPPFANTANPAFISTVTIIDGSVESGSIRDVTRSDNTRYQLKYLRIFSSGITSWSLTVQFVFPIPQGYSDSFRVIVEGYRAGTQNPTSTLSVRTGANSWTDIWTVPTSETSANITVSSSGIYNNQVELMLSGFYVLMGDVAGDNYVYLDRLYCQFKYGGVFLKVFTDDFTSIGEWVPTRSSLSTSNGVMTITSTQTGSPSFARCSFDTFSTTDYPFLEIKIDDIYMQAGINWYVCYYLGGSGAFLDRYRSDNPAGQVVRFNIRAAAAGGSIDRVEVGMDNPTTGDYIKIDYIRFYNIGFGFSQSGVNKYVVAYSNPNNNFIIAGAFSSASNEFITVEYPLPSISTNTYKYAVVTASATGSNYANCIHIVYSDSSTTSYKPSSTVQEYLLTLPTGKTATKIRFTIDDTPDSTATGSFTLQVYNISFSISEIDMTVSATYKNTNINADSLNTISIAAKWKIDNTPISSSNIKYTILEDGVPLLTNVSSPQVITVLEGYHTYYIYISFCNDQRFRYWIRGANFTFWVCGLNVVMEFICDWKLASSGGYIGTYYQTMQLQHKNGTVITQGATLYIYSNNTLKGIETVGSMGWIPWRQFIISEKSTAKWVNIWCNVTDGATFYSIVENRTFYLPAIAQALDWVRLNFYNQRGTIISFDKFRVLIHHDADDRFEWLFNNMFLANKHSTIDIYVYDLFNRLILTRSNIEYTSYLDFQITTYSYKIHNHNEEFVHINLTMYGTGYYWGEWLAPYETTEYLLDGGYYNLKVTYTNGTYTYYSNIPVLTDYFFLIEGDTLADVLNNIVMVNANLAQLNETTMMQLYSMNLTISNMNSAINTQLITIYLDLSNVNTTITTQITDLYFLLTNLRGDVITSINNLNSTVTEQFINIYLSIAAMNSSLSNQFASVFLYLYNINSTVANQFLDVITSVNAVNSSMTSQFVNVLTSLYNNDRSLFQTKLDLLAKIDWADEQAINRALEILADQAKTRTQITLIQIIGFIATITGLIVSLWTIYAKIVKPHGPRIQRVVRDLLHKYDERDEVHTRQRDLKAKLAEERRRGI